MSGPLWMERRFSPYATGAASSPRLAPFSVATVCWKAGLGFLTLRWGGLTVERVRSQASVGS